VIPLGPGPQDHRALRPPVTARTRQEALAAVRSVDLPLREALLAAVNRADPRTPQALDAFEEQQIFPTMRNLSFVYIPGATNARSIFVLSAGDHACGRCNYRLR
jgi:hypothetical protein